jgi:magnesium-transporting ATPase (P-type)
MASEGLRTLVITQKIITEENYLRWKKKFKEAQAELNDREAQIMSVVEELEFEMELLGITGVEDRL